MSLSFAAPEWLVVIPFLAWAAWRIPALGWRRGLRLPVLLLLSLALAAPRADRGGRGQDLWLLLDRSDSARDLLAPRESELIGLLERSRGPDDRLHVLDFARDAALRAEARGATLGGSETRIANAVDLALGRSSSERPTRLLLVTDGYSTEPLTGVADALVEAGVPLELRRLAHDRRNDVSVDALLLPPRVMPGEPFVVEGFVGAGFDAEVPVRLLRDGEAVASTTAVVRGGVGVVRFTDALAAGGAHRYALQVRAEGDTVRGNDRMEAWAEVDAGPRLLLVSAWADDPLAGALAVHGLQVDLVTGAEALRPERLAGARAVVINGVPAHRLSRELLQALESYVQVQGGGLLMTGGRQGFGSGGYFASPIAELLPVSMELRREHRRLAVAIAYVLDRSGSMAASVGAGLTKMDLANAGTAASIELLGPTDGVAVLAVDSEAHVVLPLSAVGDERDELLDVVRRIQSAGGGIFVHEGLIAAWKQLESAPYGQRHVVLFADAADAEEPGGYVQLLGAIRAQGGTVSVIGLGGPDDADAKLLVDVAGRGGGRMHFVQDPGDLPAVFSQETVTIAGAAFVEEVIATRGAAGWFEIAARALPWPSRLDAYNLTYLRPGASVGLRATDAEESPLIAFWQRGAGRVAAVAFPLAGDGSASARAWPQYGDLVQTLARWLAARDVPPGLGLRTRRDGSRLDFELWFDETWQDRLALRPPRLRLVEGEGGAPRELAWTRARPGHLQASVDVAPGSWYRGAAELDGVALPFGPLGVPGDVEWQLDPARLRELTTLVAASGGRERDDLASLWREAPPGAERDLRPIVLWLALLCFVAEAWRTRLQGDAPALEPTPARASPTASAASPADPTPPSEAGESRADRQRRRRFEAAKRR